MNKSLGSKIREWRMKKGITQTELAEGLVTPSMISQIESDKANPSFKLLEGISRKLNVPIDEFLLDMQDQLEEDTRYKLAKSLIGSKEYQKAISVLETLIGESAVLNKEEVKLELAEAYIYAKEFDKATHLLEGMLEEVALDRDRTQTVKLLRWLGRAKIDQHDYVLAKHYLGQAIKEMVKSPDIPSELRGTLYQNFAVALVMLGEVQEALQFYKEAINAFQGTSSLRQLGQSYVGLANTYNRLGDFKQAAEMIRIAITMFRSVNDKLQAVIAKMNFGIYQSHAGNFEEAMTQFEECVEDFTEMNEMELVANAYGEMGVVKFRQKEYQEAEKWAFRALELLPAKHVERAYVYRNLGLLYQELQNFDRSLEYMLSSVSLFENFGLLSEVSKCYSYIVSIYQHRGELDKASEYMQKMTSSMEEGLRARGLYL